MEVLVKHKGKKKRMTYAEFLEMEIPDGVLPFTNSSMAKSWKEPHLTPRTNKSLETWKNYNRQHQELRTEEGIEYGDVIEGVDFDYCAKLTGVNAITMAALAWAPPPPQNVMIGGGVRSSTRLQWEKTSDPNLTGYKVYWREKTFPQWQFSRFVGDVDRATLANIVVDNYLFGVASVGKDGHESLVVFPTSLITRSRNWERMFLILSGIYRGNRFIVLWENSKGTETNPQNWMYCGLVYKKR